MTLNSLMMKATLSANALPKLFFVACYLLLFCLFAVLSPVAAQPVNNLLGDVAMPSPEAASLGKYTDIPVGYYTGTPSISVPVHSAKDGTVSLPVSLSYHASGVKVGEPASWVGLGWSLNAGGRVIRTVLGLPDEHFGGYFFSANDVQPIPDMDVNTPVAPGTPAGNGLNGIFEGLIDGEADIFSFNFAGYSGKFYFDKNGEPVLVPKQNLLIQRHDKSTSNESDRIKGFTIIAPDGVKYHFGVGSASSQATPMVEKTAAMGENPVASSWMLVKVESVDGQHEINLSYGAEQYSYNSLGSCSSVELNSGSGCSRVNWYDVTTYRLSLISYNLGSIEFIADGSARDDLHPYQYFYNGGPYNYGPLSARRLERIIVHEGASTVCKEFTFSYGYWQDNTSYARGGAEDKRLKLLSVQESSCLGGSINIPPYTFSYIGDGGALPHRLSLAIGHWGYYNGADANNTIFNSSQLNIPSISEEIMTNNGPVDVEYAGTSDRETHEGPMLLGTLEEIKYPTGGSHRFEYEANEYYRVSSEQAPPLLAMEIGFSTLCNGPGGFSQGSVPSSISFTSSELSQLFYSIELAPVVCGNSDYPPTDTIRVYRNGSFITEAVFNVPSSGHYSNSGSLQSLFNNMLVPGVTYTFISYAVRVDGDFYIYGGAPVTVEENIKVGGLRLKKSEIDDGNGNVITREYKYLQEDSTKSSGILYNLPRYWFNYDDIQLVTGIGGGTGSACSGCNLFLENSIVPLGDFQGNHIGYSRVVEYLKGNGWTEYQFYTEEPPAGANNYSYSEYPFPPEELREIAGNTSYSSTWEETGVKQEESTFDCFCSYGNGYNDYISGQSQMVKTTTTGPGGGGILWQAYKVRTRVPFRVFQTVHTLDGVTSTTTYEYNSMSNPLHPHYNPTAMSITNSDGELHRTEYEYALEQNNPTLLGANMVSIPLQEKKYVGGLAGGWRKEYSGFYPTKYYEILQNGDSLLRGSISGYVAEGMPNAYTAMGFAPINYQWTANKLLDGKSFIDWRWGYTYHDSGGSPYVREIEDIDGQAIEYSYDGLGRLKQVRARSGAVTTDYTYEIGGGNNKITATTTYADGTPTQTIEEEFDGLSRLTRRSHNGVPKQEIFYDNAGRVKKETYQVGTYTTYEHEPSPLGRVLKATFPDGNFTQSAYSGENNYYKVSATDEKGNVSATLTDILGRQYRFVDANGGITEYEYDNRSNLSRVYPPAGDPYEYEYDVRNRMVSKKVPGSEMQLFRYYDTNDLLKYSIDGNGNRLDYTYDGYGRETLVRWVKVNGWDPTNPNASHGSPGSRIIENSYGEGIGLQINTGKMMWTEARVFDGASNNFMHTGYTYDAYGRMEQQLENNPLGTDSYLFQYNDADWLRKETRTHNGPEQLQLVTSHFYDDFGRELGYTAFADQMSDGFIFGRSYDVKDQVKAKYYGSLDPFSALDKVKLKYNIRGWVTDMNAIYYDQLKYDECGFGSDVSGDTIQIEKKVDFPELAEELCINGGDVAIDGLDPCENDICYVELADYSVNFVLKGPLSDGVAGIYGIGDSLIPLLNYPYILSLNLGSLEPELESWLGNNGYIFEDVALTVTPVENRNNIDYLVFLKISQTDYPFDWIEYTVKSNTFKKDFIKSATTPIPCNNLPGKPKGEEHEQPASLLQMEALMAGKTVGNLSYPAVLYKARFNDGSLRWAFPDELSVVKGSYTREKRLHISKATQNFKVQYTEGTAQNLSLSALLSERATTGGRDIHDIETDSPSEECNLPDLGCSYQDKKEQEESVAQIQNAMCNMYPNNYELPITLYLVELCDGSTMYILGDSLLDQLDGPHLVLDEQEITANSQVFTIVVTERKPLFAMRFEQYEPNGNIKELRWKITSRAPKYYQYSYDPLNRLTSASYGFLELPANATPGQGPQAVASEEFSVPSIGYDAVGNIKSITRKGLVFDGDCFVPREIDRLTMLYNGERPNQMSNVKDEAPIDSRVYGFKPGASFTALYQYDDNGNLTFDPHKSLTMQYNFLNLPTSIGAMSLTYDATGRKWKKDGEFGAVLYDGGIEYRDGQLEAINLPDGRLVAEYNGGASITRYRAEYFHKDHLGNTRLGFSDFNQNGYIELTEEDPGTPENELEITQESHYYPFGMGHMGPWYATVAPENRYLYNGKEWNEDYGANLYEYGARWYDPAVGRFTGVDPIADQFPNLSVFNYASNQPINNVDLHGLQGIDVIQNRMYEQYLQGKATEQDLWDMWEAQFAGGVAGLGGIGVGGLLKRGALKVLSWALMNPEAATGAGAIIWGLGTDEDVPGGGDDAGRVIRYAGSRIWKISSITERGMTIERLLGGNLPSNFPVIDKFEDGIATSIKSIDLTAKSYQEGSRLSKTINGYVDSVSDFNGRSWGGVNISKGQIKGRALEVAVQKEKVTREQWKAIKESVDYALKKNVNLSIKFVE